MKHKKYFKYLKWSFLAIIFLGMTFLATAYVNGKTVVDEDIQLQWVSHTEYWREDSASTIVRLSDYRGNPYPVDECRVTILYPDKSIFIDNQLLSQSNIPGNWYRTDYLGEAPLGTYEQEVICTRGSSIVTSSQSFHLNPALEQVSVLTEKSDNLDLKLEDVNLSFTGKISETGETINTNLTNINTSLNTLLEDVNGSISQQINQGVTTLQTDLSNVNVSINGTVTQTGEEIQTSLTNINTNLSGLLNNVNTGLLDQLDLDFTELNSNLQDVNLTLTGTVIETGDTINTNITTATTDLSNLVNNLNQDLVTQLGADFNLMQTNLSNVNLSLDAKLQETGDVINANITNSTTSVLDLLNTVNTDVSNKIDLRFQEMLTELENVEISLTGTITETGEEINTNITNATTSLTDLVNTLNVSLASDITNQFNNTNALIAQKFLDSNQFISTRIDDLEVSLNGTVQSTGQAIQTQLTDVNDNLASLINNLVIGNINVQLDEMLLEVTNQVAAVKEDTLWLVSNAINQEDMNEIRNRFTAVDSNLANIENFCSTDDTNSSALCQEIYNIKTAINIMEETQEQKLDEISQTTTNTWNLLSGDIKTNIDSLLIDIGVIRAQTTDINATVHQILDNQESEINIRIIS